MDHGLAFRPGTHDEAMFRHLAEHNEYRLPDRFEPDDIVVDIGVHVGGFSHSALSRGAGRVYGFEADPSNFACASRNLAPFGDRVRLANKAVWRSDRPAGRLSFTPSNVPANTGGGGVVWDSDGPTVESVPFDEVVREVTDGGRRRIRLLKIDCEGSEFPILLTARRLHLIDAISGEFHEFADEGRSRPIPARCRIAGCTRFTIVELTAALERAGFEVESERQGDAPLGLFFARRRPLAGRLRSAWRRLAG